MLVWAGDYGWSPCPVFFVFNDDWNVIMTTKEWFGMIGIMILVSVIIYVIIMLWYVFDPPV